MSKVRYYIAYGSNLNIRQMYWRCPRAKVAGIATLEDWRLLFRGSKSGAYLTIEPCKGAEVPVAIWRISAGDEAALDRYEGYPDFYYKKMLNVRMLDIRNGKEHDVEAMVYIMHEDRPLGLPSSSYVRTCAEGYMDFDFDLEALDDAVAFVRIASAGR